MEKENFLWTRHSLKKILQYRFSKNLIKRVIRFPERKEEGIAFRTIAVMRKKRSKKEQEIWVMYQLSGNQKKIISTWIYPGISPKGKRIFIPDEVWDEIRKQEENKKNL